MWWSSTSVAVIAISAFVLGFLLSRQRSLRQVLQARVEASAAAAAVAAADARSVQIMSVASGVAGDSSRDLIDTSGHIGDIGLGSGGANRALDGRIDVSRSALWSSVGRAPSVAGSNAAHADRIRRWIRGYGCEDDPEAEFTDVEAPCSSPT